MKTRIKIMKEHNLENLVENKGFLIQEHNIHFELKEEFIEIDYRGREQTCVQAQVKVLKVL